MEERIRLVMHSPEDAKCAVYVYKENGLAERELLGLNEKDLDDNKYLIVVPENVMNVSSSYIEGLFEGSVRNIHLQANFKEKYEIEMNNITKDIQREIDILYDAAFFDKMNEQEESKKKEKVDDSLYMAIYLFIASSFAIGRGIVSHDIILSLSQIPMVFIGLVGSMIFIGRRLK